MQSYLDRVRPKQRNRYQCEHHFHSILLISNNFGAATSLAVVSGAYETRRSDFPHHLTRGSVLLTLCGVTFIGEDGGGVDTVGREGVKTRGVSTRAVVMCNVTLKKKWSELVEYNLADKLDYLSFWDTFGRQYSWVGFHSKFLIITYAVWSVSVPLLIIDPLTPRTWSSWTIASSASGKVIIRPKHCGAVKIRSPMAEMSVNLCVEQERFKRTDLAPDEPFHVIRVCEAQVQSRMDFCWSYRLRMWSPPTH